MSENQQKRKRDDKQSGDEREKKRHHHEKKQIEEQTTTVTLSPVREMDKPLSPVRIQQQEENIPHKRGYKTFRTTDPNFNSEMVKLAAKEATECAFHVEPNKNGYRLLTFTSSFVRMALRCHMKFPPSVYKAEEGKEEGKEKEKDSNNITANIFFQEDSKEVELLQALKGEIVNQIHDQWPSSAFKVIKNEYTTDFIVSKIRGGSDQIYRYGLNTKGEIDLPNIRVVLPGTPVLLPESKKLAPESYRGISLFKEDGSEMAPEEFVALFEDRSHYPAFVAMIILQQVTLSKESQWSTKFILTGLKHISESSVDRNSYAHDKPGAADF